jgi:hypothetical protein
MPASWSTGAPAPAPAAAIAASSGGAICLVDFAGGRLKALRFFAMGSPMRTREEHLEWCKQRAREYLARNELTNAVTSMLSDLQKHPGMAFKPGALDLLGMHAIMSGDAHEVSRFIEGFN